MAASKTGDASGLELAPLRSLDGNLNQISYSIICLKSVATFVGMSVLDNEVTT